MQTTCKSNATNAQHLGPKRVGGGRRILHVVCMFCIYFTFCLHFVCIAAGDDEAAAAAVAAAADAVDSPAT